MEETIAREIRAGYPRAQAVAIGYSEERREVAEDTAIPLDLRIADVRALSPKRRGRRRSSELDLLLAERSLRAGKKR